MNVDHVVHGYTALNSKFTVPGTNDFKLSSRNGWSSIAHRSYTHYSCSGKRWVKVENTVLDLGEDHIKQIYKVLWGPLDNIWGEDKDEQEMEWRHKMVDTIRVLLTAIGIGYDIIINEWRGWSVWYIHVGRPLWQVVCEGYEKNLWVPIEEQSGGWEEMSCGTEKHITDSETVVRIYIYLLLLLRFW